MDAVNNRPADDGERAWQRLAAARPRLRDTVTIDTVVYRGRPWYLLRNQFGRAQLRVDFPLYRVLSRLDGQRTVESALREVASDAGDAMALREDLVAVLHRLYLSDMLAATEMDTAMARAELSDRQRTRGRPGRWRRWLSPRLPLVDPDRLLQRLADRAGWLFHPAVLLLAAAFLVVSAIQAVVHGEALVLYASQRVDDPRQWLLWLALYPLIKAVHEVAHGLVAKRGGAVVSEMGVTFLVFFPVPYVDASDTVAFADKRRRMAVAAAGIVAELLLAALALLLWLNLDAGVLRDLAFGTLLIGGVSSLLFNGNPLLRFDGYYVLSDAIEIPNLATRANAYYGYLARRHLFGVTTAVTPATAPGERRWLLAYAPLSWGYRLLIGITIAIFLIDRVPSVGILLALALVGTQFLLPLFSQGRYLAGAAELRGRRGRALGVTAGLMALGLALLAAVPIATSTYAEGVVLLPERNVVRAGAEGFLRERRVVDGDRVAAGDPLFVLDDPRLAVELSVARARLTEVTLLKDRTAMTDPVAREIQLERLAQARAEVADLERRQRLLVVRSPADGMLRLAVGDDHDGRLVRQGDLLAHVADPDRALVRVAARQHDAIRIRDGIAEVHVMAASVRDWTGPGRLVDEVPAATDVLPSAALGSRAGGALAVDARDQTGTHTLDAFYAFDVAIDDPPRPLLPGSRAYVRFDHAASPLLARLYGHGRRRVLADLGE
jgi:putative peptide zinc metalloprotease protein